MKTEEACSPWSSPVFILNVEDKDPRFIADMRKVNSVTKQTLTALNT